MKKKYKVTSIPTQLPKARDGFELKKYKVKKKRKRPFIDWFNKQMDKSVEKDMENLDEKLEKSRAKYEKKEAKKERRRLKREGIIPQEKSPYGFDFYGNTPEGPQTESEYNVETYGIKDSYTPEYLDELYNREYTSDKFESDNIYDNMYLDASTGEYMKCPEGYESYKGECIPTAEAIKLYDKERDKYWTEYDKKVAIKDQERKERFDNLIKNNEIERLEQWGNYFERSKKKDDIMPAYSRIRASVMNTPKPDFNEDGSVKVDEEGNPVTHKAIEDYKKTHFVHKNKDGTYSMWPLTSMQMKIYHNGFNEHTFAKYWGIDANQVRDQLGDFMDSSKKQYDQTMTQKIYKKAVEEGKPIEQVIEELPTKLGYAQNMKNEFTDPVSTQIDETYKNVVEDTKKLYDADEAKRIKYSLETDFDWGNTSEKKTIKTPGAIFGDWWPNETEVWSIASDPDGKYIDHWINQAKDSKEKEQRKKAVQDIRSIKSANPELDALEWENYTPMTNNRDDINDPNSVRNTVGYDAFRDMDDYFIRQGNLKMEDWITSGQKGRTKKLQNEKLDELTGASASRINYMRDVAGAQPKLEKEMKSIWDNASEADKIATLNLLYKHQQDPTVPFSIINKDGETAFEADPESFSQFVDGSAYKDHLWSLPQYQKYRSDYIPTSSPRTWYSNVWDVVTNPGDAIYYASDPYAEMWHPKYGNLSYNERKELEMDPVIYQRENDKFNPNQYGTATYKDMVKSALGTTHGYGGMRNDAAWLGAGMKFFNSLNPFNFGDDVSRADDKLGRASDIGYNAAMDAATIASIIGTGGGAAPVVLPWRAGSVGSKVFQGMNKFNQAQYLMGQGFKAINPFRYMAYYGKGLPLIDPIGRYGTKLVEKNLQYMTPSFALDAVRPGGHLLSKDYQFQPLVDFSQGNIGTGLGNAAFGLFGLGAGRALGRNAYGSLKSGLTTGNFSPNRFSYPEGTNFATDLKQFKSAVRPEYRSLSKTLHPDVGGSGSDMFNLNRLVGEYKNTPTLFKDGKGNFIDAGIPFNQQGQLSRFGNQYEFNNPFGFGPRRFGFGNTRLRPTSLEEMMMLNSTQPSTPVNKGLKVEKDGGLVKANKGVCVPKFKFGKVNYRHNITPPGMKSLNFNYNTLPGLVNSLRTGVNSFAVGDMNISPEEAIEFLAPDFSESINNITTNQGGSELFENVSQVLGGDYYPNQFYATSNIGKFVGQNKVGIDQLKGLILKEPQGALKWPLLEQGITSEFGTMPKSITFNDMQRITDKTLGDIYSGGGLFNNPQGYRDVGIFGNFPPPGTVTTQRFDEDKKGLGYRENETSLDDLNAQQNVLVRKGLGSQGHSNPEGTIAHTRHFVDPDNPDTLNLMEIQSDAFSGDSHLWKSAKKGVEDAKDTIKKYDNYTEKDWIYDYKKEIIFENYRGDKDSQMKFDDVPVSPEEIENFKREKMEFLESNLRGRYKEYNDIKGSGSKAKESELLEKNWESITLQKAFENAANQGLTKVRIPTEDTEALIQGFTKQKSTDMSREMDAAMEFWNTESTDTGPAPDYRREHKTVLKRYKKMPKFLKKAFGFDKKDIRMVKDKFGNSWYEVDIPKSFLKGQGQIIHQEGGVVAELDQNQIDDMIKNGWVVEDV